MTLSVPSDYIYLDYAATAPLYPEAASAMMPYLVGGRASCCIDANANSLHTPGRVAFNALELARRDLAHVLGAARPSEIVITGGATEADNAALFGLAHAAQNKRLQQGKGSSPCRVLTTRIEHEAVLKCAERLKRDGFSVDFIPCDLNGHISCEALADVMDEDVAVVSIQLANSEIGSIQPIAELAQIAHAQGAVFHTDASQALGKVAFSLSDLGVDAATFSAHKVGGPKGVGALYLRSRTPFDTVQVGGGQESGMRSGTQNVCGAVGFAAACKWAVNNQEQETARLSALRDRLYEQLSSFAPVRATVNITANPKAFLPNIVHILVDGFESETMVLKLDQKGFAVSGGSACASHSLEPSHVLSELGIPSDAAYSALRISLGRFTTTEDVDLFVQAFSVCFS